MQKLVEFLRRWIKEGEVQYEIKKDCADKC